MHWLLSLAGCGPNAPAPCDPPGTQVGIHDEIRAAGCLAVDHGRLLMVQQNDGRWSIPGGYVERGETGEIAAARETFEEAKVTVTVGVPRCAAVVNRFVAYDCTVNTASAPFADGKETRDARFLDRDEISALTPSQLRFPEQRSAYLRAIDEAP